MLSVVIPISDCLRKSNIEMVVHVLKGQTFQDFETVLVEQVIKDEGFKMHYSHLDVNRYIPICNHGNGLFCKTWCMNVGARIASGSRILFLDGDVVFDAGYLQAVNDAEGPWFVAWSENFYYTPESTKNVLTARKVYVPPTKGGGCSLFGNPGMSVAYDREWFWNELGGHHEGYFAWGGEDNDSAFRASTLTGGFRCIPYKIMHLDHSKAKIYTRQDNFCLWLNTQHNTKNVTEILKKTDLGCIAGPASIPAVTK